MSVIERKIFYFERPGLVNTDMTIKLALERVEELNIEHIVVSSLTGRSALKTAEAAKDKNFKIICVTFRAGGYYDVEKLSKKLEKESSRYWIDIPEMAEEIRKWKKEGLKKVPFLPGRPMKKKLEELGVTIVTATDMGADIECSMEHDLGVSSPKIVMNETFYPFCPGLKVSVLSAVTAADAGVIPIDKEVVSMGGTERGLDTAIVVKPSYSDSLFDPQIGLEIREIICKPRTMFGPSGFYLGRAWAYWRKKT
jgi:hypothetical protein